MKKLVVLLLIVFTTSVYAQVNPHSATIRRALTDRSILGRDYLIGIGSAPQANLNAKKQARESAIAEIYIEVAGNIRDVILASVDEPGHSSVSEYYSTVAQKPKVSVTLPRIHGIPLPPGYTYNGKVYAIVAVERAELQELYTKKADELRTKIKASLRAIEDVLDPGSAAKLYLPTYIDYEALKEAELITLGAAYRPDAKATFDKLWEYKELMAANPQRYVNEEVSEFFHKNHALRNIADIATIIAAQFEAQGVKPSGDSVQLDLFTYGISELTAPFSDSLNIALTGKLGSNWTIVSSTGTASLGINPSAKLRLSGSYWEIGENQVTVRAILRDVTTGAFEGAAILTLNKKNLTGISSYAYKPSGYQRQMQQMVADAKARLKGAIR